MTAGLRLALPTEHDEQTNFVREFRLRWPDVLIFAIPNGGKRSKAAAAKLRAEGVVAGVPDLCVPAWGLWVEMKRSKGGRLSPDQAGVKRYLETNCGGAVLVCKGAADAMRQVMEFLDQQNVEGEAQWQG